MDNKVSQKTDHEALARLVERAKAGDYDAYSEIYIIFSKKVYYLALRLTNNEEDANDIMQETMLALYNNLQSIENSRAIVSYINSVAYKQSMRVLQKRQKYAAENDTSYDLLNIEDDDEEFIPEKYIDQQENHAYFIGVIDKLSESLKAVVMLHYYDRYSISQIAETLGITEGTAKTRLSRARSILKQLLEASGYQTTTKKEILGGVILPVPVLTQILHAHADKVFTKEISTTIWQNIAEKLGLPADVIAQTTIVVGEATVAAAAASTASTAVASASAATSTLKTIVTLTTGSYITTSIVTACIAAAISGGVLIYQHAQEERTIETTAYVYEMAEHETFTNIYHPQKTNPNIDIGNHSDDDIALPVTQATVSTEQNPSPPASEGVPFNALLPSAVPVEQVLSQVTNDIPAVPPHVVSYYSRHEDMQDFSQSGQIQAEEAEMISPTEPETAYDPTQQPTDMSYEEPSTVPPMDDVAEMPSMAEPPNVEEAPSPAEPPTNAPEPPSTEEPTPDIPLPPAPPQQVEVESWRLQYSAGTAITPQQFLQDAGITFSREIGEDYTLNLLMWDYIDFNTPGQYLVIVQMLAGDDVVSQVVVIILIN